MITRQSNAVKAPRLAAAVCVAGVGNGCHDQDPVFPRLEGFPASGAAQSNLGLFDRELVRLSGVVQTLKRSFSNDVNVGAWATEAEMPDIRASLERLGGLVLDMSNDVARARVQAREVLAPNLSNDF